MTPAVAPEPRRNDPCPCGSGKKYKKCCLGKAASAPAPESEPLLIAMYNQASGLHRAGRLAEAAALYRKVLDHRPNHFDALHMLGVAQLQAGHFQEALQVMDEALQINSSDPGLHYNRSIALQELQRPREALASLDHALALKPDYAEAWNNRGTVLRNMQHLDEALTSYRRALELKPNHTGACYNISRVLLAQGRVEEALRYSARGVSLSPELVVPYDNQLLMLNYDAHTEPRAVYAAHLEYARHFEAPLKASWPVHVNTRDPERRLRIGYVSADFRDHSVALFLWPLLAHHDKHELEVYCYYNNTLHDAVTASLQGYADHWLPCKTMTDEALAARIQDDGIDILVDLGGHTRGNRLLVFARKPAPVQVSYLGYPTTTGLSAIDYRLVTADTDPPGAEAWHSERLYRLPRSLWCYRPPAALPAVEASSPARRTGFITFGSINNVAKVSDPAVGAWARLLQAVPGAQLAMTNLTEGAQRRMRERFAAHGIAPQRLLLYGTLPHDAYLALFNRIDIALDPFPYAGTTTTCVALWMGVPVVTLIGETSAARSGYALLKTIGLAELAARNVDEYLSIAIELARDQGRLDNLRGGMRARIEASVLRDEAGVTRDLEAAYRTMWRAWCRGAVDATAPHHGSP